MTGVYLFAAALGIPLVAWFLFAGDDGGDGGDGGGDGGDGGHDGIGAIMLRLLPLSSIALAAAAFGVTGLALEATGTTAPSAFGAAVVAAVLGAVVNGLVFGYLRRTESTIDASDERIVGSIGRVVLPMAEGRRGRVALSVGGQQVILSAVAHHAPSLDSGTDPSRADASATDTGASAADELEVGAAVLVVAVSHGIATVTRVDPELA